MNTGIQFAEIPLIEQIRKDEMWLLAEERGDGKPVNKDDPELIIRVVNVILRYGEEMRAVASKNLK